MVTVRTVLNNTSLLQNAETCLKFPSVLHLRRTLDCSVKPWVPVAPFVLPRETQRQILPVRSSSTAYRKKSSSCVQVIVRVTGNNSFHSKHTCLTTATFKMSNNDRNRRTTVQTVSAGSLIGAAVGLVVGLAAVEHAQAQEENRESVVQGIFRWVREDVLELTSPRRQPRGASRTARRILTRADIAALPVRILSHDEVTPARASDCNEDKSFCVICHDSYAEGDSLMRLPCFHEYHVDCIREYLESTENPQCPICRHPVAFF